MKRVLTASQHKDLLVDLLISAAGGERARWRRLVGTVFILPLLRNPFCNWSITPAGTPNEVAAIRVAVKLVRGRHPYARR